MATETTILYLLAAFPIMLITFKIVGATLFWVVSFILGNKLAAMLEEDDDPPTQQSRPANSELSRRD